MYYIYCTFLCVCGIAAVRTGIQTPMLRN